MSWATSTAAVKPPGRWATTLGIVVGAGLPGLLLLPSVVPIAHTLGVAPGLVEYCGVALAWNLATVSLLVWMLPRVTGRPFVELVRGWWTRRHADEHVSHALAVWVGAAVAGGIGLSSLRLWLIDRGWDVLHGPAWSINSPAANRGNLGFTVGVTVVLFQIVLRIPLTTFVEETLFRGWVQDRHGPMAAGVLFAAYHLSQWWTIPALIPFGIALSLLRVGTKSIWPGAALHGLGDVAYALQAALR